MRRPFVRLLLMMFLVATAINAYRPSMSYRALELGATPAQLGIVAGMFAALSLVIAIPAGRLIDRIGEPPFLLAGTLMLSTTGLVLTTLDGLVAIAIAQALLGAGQVLCVIGAQTMVTHVATQEQRDARFGIFTVVISLGQATGPALVGVLVGRSGLSPTQMFLVCSLITTASALVAVSLLRRPERRNLGPMSTKREATLPALGKVMRTPSIPPAMLSSLTVLASSDILVAYLPAYGEEHGLSVTTVSIMLAVSAGTAVVTRALLMPLVRLLGHRWLLILCIGCSAGGMLALPLATSASLPVLILIMVVIGLGLGLGNPITLSWIASNSPEGLRATALGVRMSGNRLGQLALPMAVGAIGGTAGVASIFVVTGLMLAGSGAVIAGSSFGRKPRPGSDET